MQYVLPISRVLWNYKCVAGTFSIFCFKARSVMLTRSTGCTIFLFALLSAPIELDVLYNCLVYYYYSFYYSYIKKGAWCVSLTPYTNTPTAYLNENNIWLWSAPNSNTFPQITLAYYKLDNVYLISVLPLLKKAKSRERKMKFQYDKA